MLTNDVSLEGFLRVNWEIYQRTDDRHYTSADIISYVHRNITHILKAVRKERHAEVNYRICVTLSWVGSLACRLHIDVANEIWKRFPGCCPYCGGTVCFCKERAATRQTVAPATPRPVSLRDWQYLFAAIYPRNTLQDSTMHLAEEIGELSEAFRNFLASHSDEWFSNIAEETVDIFANLFGIANCLHFDIASSLAEYFRKGCLKCQQCPCNCGYVTIDKPI
ncbi:MAG: MazG-like family protein [bacterium]|nr:MazG-like family protein [bacterium]